MNKVKIYLPWVDGLKAFAIFGILLNHFVESFGSYPWFSNPSNDWPDLSTRILNIFPAEGPFYWKLIQFLGWLGDMGPGIFILLSGLTLSLSFLNKPLKPMDFYVKRLFRIYPLYITIHIIILIFCKYLFNWNISFFSVSTLLSVLGLRFTDSLFFYVNPSWWFIWLIIQLYFLFPFLMRLLLKKGIIKFFIITLGITLISRLAGILNFTYSNSLYNWMTGLFAGTRLLEFTIGMILGYKIFNSRNWLNNLISKKFYLFFSAFIIYFVGFLCSWTLIGSLISNILITVGLSGFLFALYNILIIKSNFFKNVLERIGKYSFGVFLIHQPFMISVSNVSEGSSKIVLLITIIALSFLIGSMIEKNISYLSIRLQNNKLVTKLLADEKWILILCGIIISLNFIVCTILPFNSYGVLYKLSRLLFLVIFLILTLRFVVFQFDISQYISKLYLLILLISAAFIILPREWYVLYPIVIIAFMVLLLISINFTHYFSFFFTLTSVIVGIILVEHHLRNKSPIEVLKWGEFSALQIDDETIYSLIPNKTTHLKYNNYDYILKTNSLGFTSPELDLTKKDSGDFRIMIIGDAFSMPEGIDYKYSFPALLEEALSALYPNNNISIANAGVTGYGPIEEYSQLKKYIDTIKPDLVINQFFVNEFEEINIERNDRLKNIGFYVDSTIILKYFGNCQLPLQYSNAIKNVTGYIDDAFLYNKSLLYFFEKDSPLFSDSVVNKIYDYLSEMKLLCDSNNSKFIIMYVPAQIEVSLPKHISYYPQNIDIKDTSLFVFHRGQELVKSICLDLSIEYFDVTNFLSVYENQPVYFPESWHWNKNGHNAVSEFIVTNILDSKILH